MRSPKPKNKNRRRRIGSVMIMVVALLVLLALMGTAWIASVRNDRIASVDNTTNVQLDQAVGGLIDLLAARLDAAVRGYDLNTNPTFPPNGNPPVYFHPRNDEVYTNFANITRTSYSYAPYDFIIPENNGVDAIEAHSGNHLSARLPEMTSGIVYWPAISSPLASQIPKSINTSEPFPANDQSLRKFEAPLLALKGATVRNDVAYYVQRLNMQPTYVTLTGADGILRTYPAFTNVTVVKTDNQTENGFTVVAADADGDGVADSGFWRLPIGQQNGVTWYAAYRLVDNNSAININTAWTWRNGPSDTVHDNGNNALPTNAFPGNIDVTGFIPTASAAAEINNWNSYRFNGATNTGFTPYSDQGVAMSHIFGSEFDALNTQLGSRIDNPGYVTATLRYRPFPLSDQIALASRFVIRNTSYSSVIEQKMPDTLYNFDRATPYTSAPGGNNSVNSTVVNNWYNANFNYTGAAGTSFSRRPLFVTRNGVTNFIQPTKSDINSNAPGNGMVDYGPVADPVAVKANANTADFSELLRAYWSVMTGKPDQTPFGEQAAGQPIYDGMQFTNPAVGINSPGSFTANTTQHPQRMFRSSIRATGNTYNVVVPGPEGQLMLRAAIAANNTIAMRENKPGIMRTESLGLASKPPNSIKFTSALYGAKPQPFITEIFATDDDQTELGAGKNPTGYIAIEMVNPYTDRDLDIGGWRIGTVDRSTFGSGLVEATVAVIPAGTVIPRATAAGYSYIVIDNLAAGGAAHLPPAVKTVATQVIHLKDLDKVLRKEMVILRPAAGIGGANSDWAPVDSFDFSGFPSPFKKTDPNTGLDAWEVHAWHYVRANDKATHPWCFVYPGRYDGTKANRRQQGTQAEEFTVDPMDNKKDTDPWSTAPDPNVRINLGFADTTASYPADQVRPIQWANTGSPGPGGSNVYPFSGFARNGDILQVPFISGYRIYDNAGKLLEINAVTMDAAFAEDTDNTDNVSEQIGRFCPVCRETVAGPLDNSDATKANDWAPFPSPPAQADRYRYRWAMRLFDYLTVQDPHRDFMPNSPPEVLANTNPVRNASPYENNPNNESEKQVGVQGLININTAPWPVLASIPMVYNTDGTVNGPANTVLAQAIVLHRDGDGNLNLPNGPFRNLYDLYRVPAVWLYVQTQIVNGTDPGKDLGDLTPGSALDGVRKDYEERYLFLNRISNMVTTRSDTFNAYLLVQGWRAAGTPQAELVAQRRVGLIIDRTNLTAANKRPKIHPFSPN